jgi:[ribosomal protein S5]-alanine N-acetyltransferase
MLPNWTASIPHPYSDAMAREWISRMSSRDRIYTIDKSGLPTGVVSYDPSLGEIGYWVGREYWGRGLATEAVNQLLQLLPSSETALGIWGACVPDNLASIRVMQKAGFDPDGEITICGRIRYNGTRLMKFARLKSRPST